MVMMIIFLVRGRVRVVLFELLYGHFEHDAIFVRARRVGEYGRRRSILVVDARIDDHRIVRVGLIRRRRMLLLLVLTAGLEKDFFLGFVKVRVRFDQRLARQQRRRHGLGRRRFTGTIESKEMIYA